MSTLRQKIRPNLSLFENEDTRMKIEDSPKVTSNLGPNQEVSRSLGRSGGEAFRHLFSQALQVDNPMTVQKGDTLVGMTRKHLGTQAPRFNDHQIYTMAKSIAHSNGLPSADRIRQGQILNMPSVETLQARLNTKPATEASSLSGTANPASNRPSYDVTLQMARPPLSSTSLGHPQTQPLPTGAQPRLVVVGDSIAVGVGGSILKSSGVIPQFAEGRKFLVQDENGTSVEATGGHSTPQILKKIQKNESVKNADTAVISAATNDWVNMSVNAYYTPARILENLKAIRNELNAKNNIWILPYEPEPRALVKSLAQQYGDQTIDLADFRKADKYHPREYGAVAASVNQVLQSSAKTAVASSTLSQYVTFMPPVTNSVSTFQSTAEVLNHKGAGGSRRFLN